MEFNYSFNIGPFFEIRDSENRGKEYLVEIGEFYLGDRYQPRLLIDMVRPANTTYGLFREWYTDWFINVYDYDDQEGLILVSEHIYNDSNKNVAVILDTKDLYEARTWLDRCIFYQKKHKCNLFVFSDFYEILSNLNTDKVKIFPKDAYFDDPVHKSAYNVDKKEEFDIPDVSSKEFTWNDAKGYYATYRIGRYPIWENGWNMFGNYLQQDVGLVREHWWKLYESYKNPIDWNGLTSKEVIDHILGLDKMGLEAKMKKLKGRDNSTLSIRKADPIQHNPKDQYEATEIVPNEIKYIDI